MLSLGRLILQFKSVIYCSFTILILFFISLQVFSQNEANIWHFGDQCGLDFNTGEPVVIPNVAHVSGNPNASISDSAGNFLFSLGTRSIWNSNGQVMQNGDGLIGHGGACQGALILQKPGSQNLYYAFTGSNYDLPLGLHYSIVDMNLDEGLGAVTAEKNIFLDGTWFAIEKLTSVRHSNGRDIWIIVRTFSNDDVFMSFLLTPTGVNSVAVISPTIDRIANGAYGTMKVSPNKKYLIMANEENDQAYEYTNTLEICRFDALTGKIDFLYTLTKDIQYLDIYEPYSVEFSPDSKLLYVSYYNEGYADSMELYQYNMQYIDDSLQFKQSENFIARGPVSGLQLARDGKIYCTGPKPAPYDHVSVIHEPWKHGSDCNFEANAIYFGYRRVPEYLPNILLDHLFRFEWDGECSGIPIAFQPNFIPEPASILWDFGDSNTSEELWPVHTYEQGGEYEVFVHVVYPPNDNYPFGRIEETSRIIEVNESPYPDLGPDTLACEGAEIVLNAGNEEGMYIWSNGSFGQNANSITVSDIGIYWVKVTNSAGCSTYDSIHFGWFDKAIFNEENLIITSTSCGGSNGSISGLQIEGFNPFSFEWYDGDGNMIGTVLDITDLSVSNYFLHVSDSNDCITISDAYTITDAGDILITAVDFSSSHCLLNSGFISITASSGAGNDFSYSIDNGSNWQSSNLFENLTIGNYFVKVNDPSDCETVYENNPVVIENIEGPQIIAVNVVPESDYSADGQIDISATIPEGNLDYSIDNGNSFQTNNGLFIGLSAGTYPCIVKDEFDCDTTFAIVLDRIISQIIDAIAGDGNTCIGNATASPLILSNFTDVYSFDVRLTYDETLLKCDGYMQVHPDLEEGFQLSVIPEGEVRLIWQGQSSISLPDNSLMAELVFSAIDDGLSQLDWKAEQGESQFFNENMEPINADFQLGYLVIYTRPEITLSPVEEACEGETKIIFPLVEGGSGINTSHWVGPDNFTSNEQMLWFNELTTSMAGTYTLTVTDTINCVESKNMELIVNQGAEITFSQYDTMWVEPGFVLEAGEDGETYLWNTGETTSSIVIDSMGNYTVEVITFENCKSTDTVEILWGGEPFYLPNAFTPNGDGLNDVFRAIPKYDYVKEYYLSIYNRWGQLIYETNDKDGGWDGTYQGEQCMKGSYVYRIAYEEFGQQPRITKFAEGTVMLLR